MNQTQPSALFDTPLVHGGDWAGYSEEYGGAPLDFSANVSPLGVPDGVKKAMIAATETADRYPDPLCRSLVRKLAKAEGMREDQILCGNGAADLIFRAVLARKPKKALLLSPTFSEYEAALNTVGCEIEYFPLKEENGFAVTEDILDHIDPHMDMVFLCEPNNPTGICTSYDLLGQILRRCYACKTVLMLDECFRDFLDDPKAYSFKPYLSLFPNVVILKAFTKLYALAGIRLGYAICCDPIFLNQMRKAGQPWAVSSLAQAAGEAALDETEYVSTLQKMVQTERPWLMGALRQLGMKVIPGEANYLLFYCETPLIAPLRKRGILLRSCANYRGLNENWYRTAVRTHKDNIRLIETLEEVIR